MNQPDPMASNPNADGSDSALDVAMANMYKMQDAWGHPLLFDDPENRFEDNTYNPFIDAQNSPASGTEWAYDEHMGNLI